MPTINKQFGLADPQYDALRVLSAQGLQPGPGDGSTIIGGGLENKIYLWPADGSTISTYDPDDSGLTSALAAASNGDTVWMPACTISGDHTVPAGVALAGISREQSILSGQLTLSSGSIVIDVGVIRTATTADITCIVGPGSGSAKAVLCRLSATTTSGTPLAASSSAADTLYLEYCDVSAVKNGSPVAPFATSAETLLDTFAVNSAVGTYQAGTVASVVGLSYRVEVSGSIEWNVPSAIRLLDANYTTLDGWSTHIFSNHFQFSDGSQPIADGGGLYSASHVYSFTLPGTGAAFSARLVDSDYDDNSGSFTVNVYTSPESNINLIACKLNGAWLAIPEWSDRAAWNTASYADRHAKDIDDETFTYHNDPNNPAGASHISEVIPSAFPDNTEATTDSIVIHADGTNRDINLLPTGSGQVNIIGGRGIGFLPSEPGPDFGDNIGGIQYRIPIESMATNFFLFRGGQYVFEHDTAEWMFIITPTGVNVGSLADNTLVPLSKFEVNGNAAIGAAYVRAAAAPTNGLIVQGNVGIGNNNPTEPLLVTGNIKSSTKVTAKPATAGIELDPNAATGNFTHSLSPANLTGNRRATFKDADGTVAYTSDIVPGALNDLTDVDTTGTGTGDIIYNNAGTWEDYPLGVGTKVTANANKMRIGGIAGGNYFEIDTTTGSVRLIGDATAWDDMRITADVVKPGATAPNWKAFGPSGNLKALMFEAGHHDEATFSVQLPHQWKVGSNIYPHVHWTPVNTTAGNVVWELEYSWANIGDAFGAPGNMATDATAAGGTAWVHKLTDFKESGNNYISGAGKTMSSMLMCRIHRNSNSGSDTLNQDVALLEIDFHFEIDSFGSDTRDVKDESSAMFLESGDYLLLESGDNLLLE